MAAEPAPEPSWRSVTALADTVIGQVPAGLLPACTDLHQKMSAYSRAPRRRGGAQELSAARLRLVNLAEDHQDGAHDAVGALEALAEGPSMFPEGMHRAWNLLDRDNRQTATEPDRCALRADLNTAAIAALGSTTYAIYRAVLSALSWATACGVRWPDWAARHLPTLHLIDSLNFTDLTHMRFSDTDLSDEQVIILCCLLRDGADLDTAVSAAALL